MRSRGVFDSMRGHTAPSDPQALKKARQFEVGKLKRRVKTAGSQQEREKLAAQLSALSRLDLDAAAQQVHSCISTGKMQRCWLDCRRL